MIIISEKRTETTVKDEQRTSLQHIDKFTFWGVTLRDEGKSKIIVNPV